VGVQRTRNCAANSLAMDGPPIPCGILLQQCNSASNCQFCRRNRPRPLSCCGSTRGNVMTITNSGLRKRWTKRPIMAQSSPFLALTLFVIETSISLSSIKRHILTTSSQTLDFQTPSLQAHRLTHHYRSSKPNLEIKCAMLSTIDMSLALSIISPSTHTLILHSLFLNLHNSTPTQQQHTSTLLYVLVDISRAPTTSASSTEGSPASSISLVIQMQIGAPMRTTESHTQATYSWSIVVPLLGHLTNKPLSRIPQWNQNTWHFSTLHGKPLHKDNSSKSSIFPLCQS
jgi:hypothetical protein